MNDLEEGRMTAEIAILNKEAYSTLIFLSVFIPTKILALQVVTILGVSSFRGCHFMKTVIRNRRARLLRVH